MGKTSEDLHEDILEVVEGISNKFESFIREIHLVLSNYQSTVVDLSERFKSYEEYMKSKCFPAFMTLEQERIKMNHDINSIKEKLSEHKSKVNGHDKQLDVLDNVNTDIGSRLFLVEKELREIKDIVKENRDVHRINEKHINEINNELEWLRKLKNQFQTALFALVIAIIFSSGALIYTNIHTMKDNHSKLDSKYYTEGVRK